MSKEKEIGVYADWHLFDSPRLVGKLYFSALRGKTVYSFEYDKDWIKSGIAIDPEIPLFPGLHYSSNDNFGIFKDASPDRWGQLLMKRREILLSKIKKTEPRVLSGIDFLLGVHDRHRMGGLRFKEQEEDEFLNNEKAFAAPPWASLRELEWAVEQYEKNADRLDEASLKWINQLIAPGSSLGGARPKADVIDSAGHLWIAKFPSQKDDYDMGLWEMIVHDLALQAKITVPNAIVRKLHSNYHTYLSQRFDRTGNEKRIHYASAMTLLGHTDGDDADSGAGYLELVEFIKSECTDVTANLEELFRRILFSVCVSNTDDHLRNHGFIYTETGWTLSPAFDINANETGTGLKLNINEDDNSLDLDLVMSTASYYLLSGERANQIKKEVLDAVAKWREVAKKYKATPSEIEQKVRAFR
ncbi:MAG: type II toxin-antitoxin system HipA family toxin [Candidatus Symbiothrix sp.]|jgi:serine/threonine-protein kinase HipA|nr:type II toxin-antitoxin system HipA family toxin [Candidatus Symbiothrix sp.]